MADNDWAWPKLIDSLQRDISQLQSAVEAMRQQSSEAAIEHRKEIDSLIQSLRVVRDEIRPLAEKHKRDTEGMHRIKVAWAERAGWAVLGGIAYLVWQYFKGLPH